MPTVQVTWPKDADGNIFSIDDWLQTLSADEQEEWTFAKNKHQQMIDDAVSNGDAVIEPDTIHWNSDDVWQLYQEKYLTPEVRAIEGKYWAKFLETHNLKRSDIFGK